MKCSLKSFILFSSFFSILSCSHKGEVKDRKLEKSFSYTDPTGSYVLKENQQFLAKKNNLITKRELVLNNGDNRPLEKSISISEYGFFKIKGQKVPSVRPVISQYTIWLEGKKYFNQIKVDKAKKAIDLIVMSPDENLNGKKHIRFPSRKGVFCFFSQIVDCVKSTGFINDSIKEKEQAVMPITVIWDGYPFIQEQYSNIPSEVFSSGKVVFEGVNASGEVKLLLKLDSQAVAYQLDQELALKKMYWITQGITVEDISL